MPEAPAAVAVRVLTSSDPEKQTRQRLDLLGSSDLHSYMIVARDHAGSWTVLGQRMDVTAMAQAVYHAARGVAHADQEDSRITLRANGIGKTMNPGAHGKFGKRIEPRHRTAADGTLIAPPRESFMRCGECESPGFYATVREDGLALGRLVCTRCGNEIAAHLVTHTRGKA